MGSGTQRGNSSRAGPRPIPNELLYALLPSSQAVEYASRETQNLNWFPLYSLAVITLSTGTGILLFRKKDLK